MLFVVDKPLFQQMIAIVRDDRTPATQGQDGPFLRIEAADGRVRLDGRRVSAEFAATVYEPGVLFIRITRLRRFLRMITIKEMKTRHLTLQVDGGGLVFDNIRFPFELSDMLLYVDPATAPPTHPRERLEQSRSSQRSRPDPTLFEDIEEE